MKNYTVISHDTQKGYEECKENVQIENAIIITLADETCNNLISAQLISDGNISEPIIDNATKKSKI